MARYRLRFFFDAGSTHCLWAGDAAANERFDSPIEAEELPLPVNTWRRLDYLCAWHATSLDWDDPSGPSPWSDEDRGRFNEEARRMLAVVREQLGPEFEVVDESRTADGDRPSGGHPMPWFRLFIHGRDFPGALIGEVGLVGFYTTRYVEADDAEAAEWAGLALLRADPHLAPPPGSTPTGEARVFFERIEPITPEDVPAVQAGFTWYAERDGE